ncbi:hypothetical protein COLO4_32189 [Corchorus olitorius]|uniref:Uncharacterized protein n=1 Tax=Corchorus olitorius TaxID=93759 RepID=A0A1R3H0H9_9ROSI|nr:hypothetical protein COLO4_32189 [Corchorus olitorius]
MVSARLPQLNGYLSLNGGVAGEEIEEEGI